MLRGGAVSVWLLLAVTVQQDPPVRESADTRHRSVAALYILIPADSGTPYDIKEVIHQVLDDHSLFEIMPDYAKK